MAQTGVFPVYENQFKIGADKATATTIADMETFSVSFSNGVETWTPMEHKGWQRALMTAKAVTITINGKRNKGDTGNDFIAKKAFTNGRDSEGYFCWTFPDGTTVEWDMAVFDVKNMGAGDSTNVAPLEFDVISNGKPTVTPSV
nr:MAG TPA: major tail protein [Caudoviricetes sp.]